MRECVEKGGLGYTGRYMRRKNSGIQYTVLRALLFAFLRVLLHHVRPTTQVNSRAASIMPAGDAALTGFTDFIGVLSYINVPKATCKKA